MGKFIVLIEDSSDDEILTTRALRNHPMSPDITTINDAEDALRWLRVPSRKPDLVLVDISMPKINGIEIVRQAKKMPHYLSVPFVMLTGSKMQSDIIAAYQAGAASYIVKRAPDDPLDWNRELRSVVHYWLTANVTLHSKNLA